VRIITDERCTGYSHPGHPERPERISTTYEKLRHQTELPITWTTPSACDDAPILRAHSAEHLARLPKLEEFDADTPAFPGLLGYARASVSAALDALNAAQAGERVFSLMRPPGHHALRSRAMGFCYLNNIAIAALEALARGVTRVAVFDFDVHHGNGTESMLADRPECAFFSVHQFPCYPGTGTRNVGSNCFNYPLPPQVSRAEYRHVLSSALNQLRSFQPNLIAVSAGFDAYRLDPLAQGSLETKDFHWLGHVLGGMGVPMFSVLEGGYSQDLPELILAYLKGVEGK
jgi:acetoin utilization deacetylase AcuC-like enzyme